MGSLGQMQRAGTLTSPCINRIPQNTIDDRSEFNMHLHHRYRPIHTYRDREGTHLFHSSILALIGRFRMSLFTTQIGKSFGFIVSKSRDSAVTNTSNPRNHSSAILAAHTTQV